MAAIFPAAIAMANGLFPQPQTSLVASATGAAAIIEAILGGAASKFTYISGFAVTGAGATAASVITVTIQGVIVADVISYKLAIPAGATVSVTPLIVNFAIPLPATAVNSPITVNVPPFGAGNLHAAVNAYGFRM